MRFAILFLTALLIGQPAFAGYETGSANQVLRVPAGGGRPKFGAVDVSQSAAVTGALPILNGGTGQTTATNGFNALAPATAKGGMIVGSGTNTYVNLAVGTDGTILTADSSQTNGVSFSPFNPTALVQGLSNIGLSTSVSGNALTIALKQNDGSSNCSSSAPCRIVFRNSTATTGGYGQVSVTAALSITVRSGDTLGQISGVSSYVLVYALNDAGTVDLCVSGVSIFDDWSLQSSSQITGSALTSGSTLYCGSSHSGSKPIRFLGRLLVNEATAGTWASAPTEVSLGTPPKIDGRTTYLKDVKTNNTAPQALTSGSYVQRNLNTQEGDTSFCTLSSNQFTLSAGTYKIYAVAPALLTVSGSLTTRAKLKNVTDSTDVILGQNSSDSNPGASGNVTTINAVVMGQFTITATKTFEIDQRVSNSANGGLQNNYSENEIYTMVQIEKIY